MKKAIWTAAARRLLYELLVDRFGPYENWERSNYPSSAERAAFTKFCDDFANVIRAHSGRAVLHQIQWSVGVQTDGDHHWPGGQSRNAVLNMAAAFEAGFIKHADFPVLVASNGKASRARNAA